MASRKYPEQGYRTCMGILELAKDYDPARVEAAARRALRYKTCSFRSMNAILAAGLDRQTDGSPSRQLTLFQHDNIRGQEYYATNEEENNA